VPGAPPTGLDIETPKADRETVTVRGAQSDVARVAAARVSVPVDASGTDVDRDFPLVPIDELGEPVRGVDSQPSTVRVTMAVIEDRTTATVPIAPVVTGRPGAGFEVIRVTTDVPTVSLEGDKKDLATVDTASTEPVSIEGQTSDVVATVAFALPSGVSAVSPKSVEVHVVIRPIVESRSFSAGVVLAGTRSDRTYALSVPAALVTIGGAPADLDRLSGATLSLAADVAGLDSGVHEVGLTIDLSKIGSGLSLVAISPATISVTVGAGGSPAPPPSGGG
jgi:YbbR domain-containing protein